MTSHAGTHIDALSHVSEGGASIEGFNLERFYGSCRVLDMSECSEVITVEALEAKDIKPGERVLLKTKNSARGFDKFYDDWVALTSDGAVYLAECGVALAGIDWLGIKQKGAPDNLAHTALLEKGIPIIEGLDLSKVSEGEYTLAAFPLAYQGIDGAPARAVLIVE